MKINKIAQGLANRPVLDLTIKTPKIKPYSELKLPKTVKQQEMLNDLVLLAKADATKALINIKKAK